MQPMKGTTAGSDPFTELKASRDKLGFKQDRQANVTMVGCPNLTGINVGLLRRIQD